MNAGAAIAWGAALSLGVVLGVAGCGAEAEREAGREAEVPSRMDAEQFAAQTALAPAVDVRARSTLEARWSHEAPARLGLGRSAEGHEIAALDIDVRPDGLGLPAGSGSVAEGGTLYAQLCVACHGPEGVGGPEGSLVGRNPGDPFLFGDGERGVRTIGSYWPWPTTVFDYVRRAMPWDRPGSLTNDQVYALTAWLLHRNGIIEADATLDAQSLPEIVMPARDRFVPDDRLTSDALR